MPKIIISILILLTAFTSVGYAMELKVPSLSDKEVSRLNELATYIDEQGAKEKYLSKHLAGNSYPVRAISAALLYRLDQKEYRDALQEEFSVDDYEARSKGEYNFIPKEVMLDVVGRIEKTYPQITDGRIQMLLAFYAFRDSNMWVSTARGNISMARFFRSAFLAAVFEGTGLDAAAVANSIDKETQKGN